MDFIYSNQKVNCIGKKQQYLIKMKINQAMKKLGVFPKPVASSTVYRKIVGKKRTPRMQ
jgi:hypothetical protein